MTISTAFRGRIRPWSGCRWPSPPIVRSAELSAAAVTELLVAKCTAGISAEGWYLGSSM